MLILDAASLREYAATSLFHMRVSAYSAARFAMVPQKGFISERNVLHMGKVPAVACGCKAAFACFHLVSSLLLTTSPLALFVLCCHTQECFATALASFETPLVTPAVPVLALPTSAPPQEPIASPTDKVRP